ncbi:MAG: preprotein translocase subunit SecY [Planctomycetota bacterium]
MLKIIRDIFKIPELRKRIFWTLALLLVFRLGFHIYVPGIDIPTFLKTQESKERGALDWLIYTSALTGGRLSSPCLFSLGIMPYISASIIFSLMVKVFPRLEALSKEGEQGRRQIARYTRYATVAICLIQSFFLVSNWVRVGDGTSFSTAPGFFSWTAFLQVLALTAGSMFVMWLGEKITEVGIGNGSSLIIMVGIIADMPAAFGMVGRMIASATSDERPFEVTKALVTLVLYFAVVAGVVFITKGQRRIPVQQQRAVKGRRVYGGQRQYMPIRVNAAGVLPIIFAQSLVLIPSAFLSNFALQGGDNFFFILLYRIARAFHSGGFIYVVAFVGLIFFFTYFWTTLMFNPVEIAGNMKEYGSFIPGIRPGKFTAEYLDKVIKRITLAGAAFLCAIALVPRIVATRFGMDYFVAHFLGGTTILIVVGVALDLVDKIEAQLLVRQYEGFMRGGELPRRKVGMADSG